MGSKGSHLLSLLSNSFFGFTSGSVQTFLFSDNVFIWKQVSHNLRHRKEDQQRAAGWDKLQLWPARVHSEHCPDKRSTQQLSLWWSHPLQQVDIRTLQAAIWSARRQWWWYLEDMEGTYKGLRWKELVEIYIHELQDKAMGGGPSIIGRGGRTPHDLTLLLENH